MASFIVDVHNLEKLRALGAIEQFSSARHHLGFYHNVGISATYTHPSLDILTVKAAIFSALAVVIDRHPILSAIVVAEDSAHPYFARLPSINLEEAVTFHIRSTSLGVGADIELDAILQEQHKLPFKARYSELPLWRVIILMNESQRPGAGCEFTASFIFHHSLGDGGSGMTFHKHFLFALNTDPPALPDITIPTLLAPLPPPLEKLHPFLTLPSPPLTLANLWSGTPIILPLHSNFHSLVLPSHTSTLFLAACRSNNTTLTATLPVLIASVLSSLLPETYTNFEACIPINLRRFLPSSLTETEPMGVFIDAISQYYTRSSLSPRGFWDEARRSKDAMTTHLETAGTHLNIAKLGTVKDMRDFFLSKVGKERGSSFDVSNLGHLGSLGQNDGGWEMGRMVFSRSAFVSGSAFSTCVVTGPDGCLVLGFVWQEGVVEKEVIKGVVRSVETGIQRIAREGDGVV